MRHGGFGVLLKKAEVSLICLGYAGMRAIGEGDAGNFRRVEGGQHAGGVVIRSELAQGSLSRRTGRTYPDARDRA